MLEAELCVECQMTNPPRPVQFGVRVGGKIVALLSREEVGRDYNEFLALEARREAVDRRYRGGGPGSDSTMNSTQHDGKPLIGGSGSGEG